MQRETLEAIAINLRESKDSLDDLDAKGTIVFLLIEAIREIDNMLEGKE